MQQLSPDNRSYRSIEAKPSWLARWFPSFFFYCGFMVIVFSSSRKAKQGRYHDEVWQASSVAVLRLLERTGVCFRVSGLEHIRKCAGPVLFVGNHLSVLETTILPSFILPFKPITYVVKQSLLEYPVFKHVMISRDPVAVTRINPRQDLKTVLEEGGERLSRGISVVIFPQTTRASFTPEQFSTIGVKLAKKAGVPIIPLALKTDAWENGKRLKDFGRIVPSRTAYFAFGEPLTVQGKGTVEHQRIIEHIQTHLSRWQG